jgi:hypothetical protein
LPFSGPDLIPAFIDKITDYLFSDGGTSKKKLEARSDLTLGGSDINTGRGKSDE